MPSIPLKKLSLFSFSHLPAHTDHHVARRPLAPHARILHLPHHVHAIDHLAEDDVFVVQERGRDGADEELGAVGVGAGVLFLVMVS